MSVVINHEWLDTAEQRAQVAASVTLPIDQFLALLAVARNGLRPRSLAATPAPADAIADALIDTATGTAPADAIAAAVEAETAEIALCCEDRATNAARIQERWTSGPDGNNQTIAYWRGRQTEATEIAAILRARQPAAQKREETT